MRTPPFPSKLNPSTVSDTLDKRPRKSNHSYTFRTNKTLDSNHNRPSIVHRSALLSKFSPIFGRSGPKGASRLLNIERKIF